MKNYGLKEIFIDETQYVLGSFSRVPKLVLQKNGQWDRYLPLYEPQADKYETDGCTVWGWQNLIEILHKRLYNKEANYNERFTYIRAGVKRGGANPHKVAECIRADGLIDHSSLSVPSTYEEFLNPADITGSTLAEGQQWLHKYEFLHEWLWSTEVSKERRTKLLKEALQYSPVGVSVTAWIKKGNVYVDGGKPNHHWCVIYGWNKYGWKIFDSYDHSEKILSYDHKIRYAKRAYLTRATRKHWIVELFNNLFT